VRGLANAGYLVKYHLWACYNLMFMPRSQPPITRRVRSKHAFTRRPPVKEVVTVTRSGVVRALESPAGSGA
jgi:hypothetical protein